MELKVYDPNIKKLDTRTVSGYFIGYQLNTKGYRFYCPSHSPRIVEARNAKFLEDHESSGSDFPRKIEIEEEHMLNESLVKDLIVSQYEHSVPIREQSNQEQSLQEDNNPTNDLSTPTLHLLAHKILSPH